MARRVVEIVKPVSSKTVYDKVQLFHVGGVGGIGPAAAMYGLGADGLHQTIFEAGNENPAPASAIPTTIIPKCLWSEEKDLDFHTTWKPLASSVFLGSKKNAKLKRIDVANALVIDEMCHVVKTDRIHATTLDRLIEQGEVPIPDYLSMDVQGAELDIMKGSIKAFESDLLAVCTEVEFQELYEGQPLFADQDQFLRKYQFSLWNFHNVEYWYPGLIMYQGAFTVAEAIYFRDINWFVERYGHDKVSLLERLLKLALTARQSQYYSYGLYILDYISIHLDAEYHDFQVKHQDAWFTKELIAYHTRMCNERTQFEKIPTWFQSTGYKPQ